MGTPTDPATPCASGSPAVTLVPGVHRHFGSFVQGVVHFVQDRAGGFLPLAVPFLHEIGVVGVAGNCLAGHVDLFSAVPLFQLVMRYQAFRYGPETGHCFRHGVAGRLMITAQLREILLVQLEKCYVGIQFPLDRGLYHAGDSGILPDPGHDSLGRLDMRTDLVHVGGSLIRDVQMRHRGQSLVQRAVGH